MLEHPIIVITDGQNKLSLERLLSDPGIGPMIRQVKPEASSFGGDVTLAVMANVFIGNPASTMSDFIVKSRVSLGFGNKYMYRAKDENGKWTTVCGDDCLFVKHPFESFSHWLSQNKPPGPNGGPPEIRISKEQKDKVMKAYAKANQMSAGVAGDTNKLLILAQDGEKG
mmetsp:Transcript_41670/g.76162  ORF Transcript_41670/g.76162 Transcript_41670/m.76162 type:complete len:169 (+) Transcript_41670:3-509(+)